MRATIRLMLLLGLAIQVSALGQEPVSNPRIDGEAGARIRALTDRLRFRLNDPADQRRYYAEMDDVTARLRTEVDAYVSAAFGSTSSSETIQRRLRLVLSGHTPNAEYGDLAFAQTGNLLGEQSLLIAYTLVRPPHDDISTIRGYRARGDRFELVATAGDDFDGYGMFKRALPSPFPGELWLMAWGPAHTFNGNRVRFRVYAFDGFRFRTIWSPEDVFNASVRFTETGFVLEHSVPRSAVDIQEEYVLTPAGPVRTALN